MLQHIFRQSSPQIISLFGEILVTSSLTGLGLLGYIDGSILAPQKFIQTDVINPDYNNWNRQDKYILSALLGSCSEIIQPLISTAATSKAMWDQLIILYANRSRSRIMSLKSHLMNNPCNSRTMSDYLRDIRITADELAIAGQPVSDDDLVILTLSGLGDEYKNIKDALSVREAPLSFGALHEQLVDYERGLKVKTPDPVVVTANYSHRATPSPRNMNNSAHRGRGYHHNHVSSRSHSNRPSWHSQTSTPATRLYRHFCQRTGHNTKECRQLARFLRENGINAANTQVVSQSTANVTSMNSSTPSQGWLFDTGASHHITNDPSNLTNFSDYGGPDEILLGNGSGLQITHTGTSNLHSHDNTFKLSNVLCVPSINQNLISVAKFCLTNNVSVEFFPSQFLVKDLTTGAILLRGENKNDMYYASHSGSPILNVTQKSDIASWHHRLGHPHSQVLKSILVSNKLVNKFPSSVSFDCNSCLCNKSRKLPFGYSSMHSSSPLELIYTDLGTNTYFC